MDFLSDELENSHLLKQEYFNEESLGSNSENFDKKTMIQDDYDGLGIKLETKKKKYFLGDDLENSCLLKERYFNEGESLGSNSEKPMISDNCDSIDMKLESKKKYFQDDELENSYLLKEEYFNEEESLGSNSENCNEKPIIRDDCKSTDMKLESTIHEEFNVKDEFSSDSDSDSNIYMLPRKPIQTTSTDEIINWPEEDLTTLIKRIELAVPDNDNLAYSTRVEKLNWDDIAFKGYSGNECKKTWLLIQKRVRRFRLLGEVLQDAKQWVSKPWTDYYRRKKTKNDPDMPRRPLSVYMLFYLKKKNEILSKNPGLEMAEVTKEISQIYKNISPKEKETYTRMAAREKKNYEKKLQEFYLAHPEIPRQVEKPSEIRPNKPSTPFYLFYQDKLKNSSKLNLDNHLFKEECKKQWKNLPDKKKLVWINLALENEAKYQDELKNYKIQNPDFTPPILKPVLTKEEKSLKERLAGKPIKPPCSAYSVFTTMMLQSEDIKKIPPKERMKAVADEWKNCTDDEKKSFQERWTKMMNQYKQEFALYLKSLPNYKRQEELQKLPKRKLKETTKSDNILHKKKKLSEEKDLDNRFKDEPAQPPTSGFSLFSNKYKGEAPAKTAWKNLTKQEKEEYEAEVKKLKHKYIKEYEEFLKSLSKKKLLAFAKLKQKRNQTAASSSKDNESEESSESDDSESENESSDALVKQE